MQQKSIHWFPGHMQKALREISEKVKIMDIVIELLDARAPLSCRNDYLYDITKQKKRLVVLTKYDLADKQIVLDWKKYFENLGNMVVLADLNDKKVINEIIEKIEKLGEEKHLKEKNKGMKPQPLKTMIVGIPNVGKSTLINKLAKRKAASVQNTPGHTRSQQWIKVGNSFELLDTPGVLPAYYEEKNYVVNLALIGSIKQDILPTSDLVDTLINFLKNNYREPLQVLYEINDEQINDNYLILEQVARRRGFLTSKGYDISRAELLLLKEFKDGTICKVCLERVGE